MTLITKTAISLFISAMSIFMLAKPPAPTAQEMQPAPITIWQGLEQPAPLPTTTVQTTPITQPDACGAVFDMAMNWPQLSLLLIVNHDANLTRLTQPTQMADQTVLCKSINFGANHRVIGQTDICRRTA
jgi:hypothetical protein